MRLFAILLTCCLLLSGCGSTPTYRVETRISENGEWMDTFIANPINGVRSQSLKYQTIFVITPEDLVAKIDSRAAEKGYSKLTDKDSSSDYLWFNDPVHISLDLSDGGIRKIKLSLSSYDEEGAKANGEYLYFLIDIFNPSMQELISNELQVFEERTADSPKSISIYCGNTLYSIYDSELSITPLAPPYVEPPKPPVAIRPQ